MSNSITDMQLFFMGLHENDHTFSCKNTDQLSSLWAAFTKCKRNIRDGFRLENMSWRLWSRQALMRKKRLESETAIVLPELTTAAATSQQQSSPSPSSSSTSSITSDNYTKSTDTALTYNEYTAPRLVRTRSLPSLSCQAQHIMDSCQAPAPTSSLSTDDTTKECSVPIMTSCSSSSSSPSIPKQSKFYIHQDDDDDTIDDFEESDVESLYNHDDGDYFDDDMDMNLSCYSSDTTSSSSYPSMDSDSSNNKPVSLLTNLLQKDTTISELRRSNCCERLDLWFSGALSS